MGFEKKEWKNRIAEYPTRRNLLKEDGSIETVTVERNEGNVSQEGDAFSEENMNNLEQRIADAIGESDIPEELGTDIISAINALNTGLQWYSKTRYIMSGKNHGCYCRIIAWMLTTF